MGVNKVIYGGKTLIDLSGVTVTPETLGAGITAYNAAGELIVGTGQILVRHTWKKYASVSVYSQGSESSSMSYGVTSSIYGSKTATFNANGGTWTLGSKSTYSLASLYSSGARVYTSTSDHSVTSKVVTAEDTTTAAGTYEEGSWGSVSEVGSRYSGSLTCSGYRDYSFNSSTGAYSTAGSYTSIEMWYDEETSSDYLYTMSGGTLTRTWLESNGDYVYKYEQTMSNAVYVPGPTSYTYDVRTYVRKAVFSHYTAGSYIEDVTAEEGTYPDNGYQSGYYYIRT